MSLLKDILGCGKPDLNYAENWYSICEHFDSSFSISLESISGCNSVIYQCMSFINDYVLNKVISHVLENEDIKWGDRIICYCHNQLNEPDIYVNSLESYFNNVLDCVDQDDFKQAHLIEDVADYILSELYNEAA